MLAALKFLVGSCRHVFFCFFFVFVFFSFEFCIKLYYSLKMLNFLYISNTNKPILAKFLGTSLKTRIQQLITEEELENPG
jgi:hypothetical protein